MQSRGRKWIWRAGSGCSARCVEGRGHWGQLASGTANRCPARDHRQARRSLVLGCQELQELIDATLIALKAIDARNAEELSNAGGEIDAACESCHLTFWYPNEKK